MLQSYRKVATGTSEHIGTHNRNPPRLYFLVHVVRSIQLAGLRSGLLIEQLQVARPTKHPNVQGPDVQVGSAGRHGATSTPNVRGVSPHHHVHERPGGAGLKGRAHPPALTSAGRNVPRI